jgi:SAM-dependent methyltransferase
MHVHDESVAVEYVKPMYAQDPKECLFYHVMQLPGIGMVGEQWDLRDTVEEYLGNFNFQGKRALDVGTASGFLTFEMEKRGASVVSVDLESGDKWDLVPFVKASYDKDAELAMRRDNIARLKRGYWLAHRLLESKARVYYGNIYELPDALGLFDVVVLGAILLHLRDPFKALQSACKLSRDAVIVTDLYFSAETPVMQFVPDWDSLNPKDTWWLISEKCMVQMLKVVGFPYVTITHYDHRILHHPTLTSIKCSTYLGRRSL